MYDKIIGLKLIRFLQCGLLLVQIGCVTTNGGVADVGRIIHANQQLDETVAVSALAAYKATVAAIQELNMSISSIEDKIEELKLNLNEINVNIDINNDSIMKELGKYTEEAPKKGVKVFIAAAGVPLLYPE